MKKKSEFLRNSSLRLQFDLKMKLSILFLFASFCMLQANDSYAQKTKVTLHLKDVTIGRLIDEIESKTDFLFVYKSKDVDIERTISIKAKRENVESILNRAFQNTNTSFNVIKKQIFLTRRITISNRYTPPKIVQGPIWVTGTVTDPSGNSLPGVSVVLKGTKNGVATDFDGNYNITVPGPESILVFTSMGFDDKEITVGNRQVLNVTLKEAVSELDEVVVSTGYWQEKKKLSTGNIGRIDAKTIERQPVLNPLEALQGQVAGVFIEQTSGLPGAAININIRGLNSLNNGTAGTPNANLPFIVIDGVPFLSESLNQASIIAGISGNPLENIRPGDIESIEVLKDAAATAIYGSRGANGVILITTKKGKPGKTRVELDISNGLQWLPNKMDLLNTEQFFQMRREGIANDGVILTPGNLENLQDLFIWDQDRETDWQEELLGGTAENTLASLAISGGSERTQFMIRGSFTRRTNIFRYTDDTAFKSGSGLINLNHRSQNDRFKADLSASYTFNENRLPGGAGNLVSSALRMAPNAPALFDEEGNLNWEGNFANPLAFSEEVYENQTRTLVSSLRLGYELLPGLNFSTRMGITSTQTDEIFLRPLTAINPLGRGQRGGSVRVANASTNNWIIEPQLNYIRSLGSGTLNILLGSTFQNTVNESLDISGFNYDSDILLGNLDAAPSIVVSNAFSEYRYAAVFGRIYYNWQDRYILDLTGRRDGSSRFGPGRRFGNFWALSVNWLFSNEPFLRDLKFLSFGKLRGTYGLTGNDQIGDYQFLDTYGSNSNFLYNNESALVVTRAANPNYSWEESRKLEFTLELGFFKDRISLTTSWFRNRTDNQLIGQPLSDVTGFQTLQFNLPALVENRGWEVDLNTVNIQSRDFVWRTVFNFSRLRNELVEFPNIEAFAAFDNAYQVGGSIFGRKQFKSLGVNPETGVYEIADLDGNGIINTRDRQDFVDNQVDFFAGLTNSVSWKGFQLDVFFRFVKQNDLDPLSFFSQAPGSGNGNSVNMPVSVLQRWQRPGDLTNIQRFTLIDRNATLPNGRHRSSNRRVVDASFIRLQNVSLSWSLPDAWAAKLHLERARLYIQGQNLLTFTPYTGMDPETGIALPPLGTLVTGIQFTF